MKKIVQGILVISTFTVLYSCASQKASYYLTQKQLDHHIFNLHETLKVDEYLNAFDQDWLEVSGKDLVYRLDRLDGYQADIGRNELVQLIVKSRKLTPEEMGEPIGISFVIDVSGSMTGEKIEDTKTALKNSILELTDGDMVSVVTFNHEANVIYRPTVIDSKSRKELLEKVSSLYANGSTNIESGLVLGYKELSKFPYDMEKRLLMLTDGISTVDTITPQEIARKARVPYLEGLRISTIGLGLDVDQNLLRDIAKEGGGHFYFADTSKTLTSILRDDLKTTVVPISKETKVTVELGAGYKVSNVFGPIEEEAREGSIVLNFGEINANDWRVVLIEVERTSNSSGKIKSSGKFVSHKDNIEKLIHKDDSKSLGNTQAFLRNAIIYSNASAMVEASRQHNQNNSVEADKILGLQINNNERYLSAYEDEDIKKELDTLSKAKNIVVASVKAGKREGEIRPKTPRPEPDRRDPRIKEGLYLMAEVLPGVWSTVARALAFSIK